MVRPCAAAVDEAVLQQQLALSGVSMMPLALWDFSVLNSEGWTCPFSDVDEGQAVYVRGMLRVDSLTSATEIASTRVSAARPGTSRPTP